MGHTTVRISHSTHNTLRALSEVEGKPMQALLDEAVEALRRRRFLEGVNAAYASLRADPKKWEELERERRQWQPTLLDGLAVREPGPGYGPSKTKARKKKA